MATTAKTTPQHPGLIAALSAVQGELPKVTKGETAKVQTRDGGSYRYTYASLTDVSEAILPVLSKHGLAWTTMPTIREDGRYVLRCKLAHTSGDVEVCEIPLPDRGNPQELGGAITFARRYALCAMTGIAPDDEDDDAAASTQAVTRTRQEPERTPRPPAPQQRPTKSRRPTHPTADASRQAQDPIAILEAACTESDKNWHIATWRQVNTDQLLPVERLTDHHYRLLRAAGADIAQVSTLGDALKAIGLAAVASKKSVASLVAPYNEDYGAETDADGA